MMHIRPLTIDEVPACIPYAKEFHQEMKLPGTIIPEVFLGNWRFFLATYPTVILSLWKSRSEHVDELVGGLGAMVSPDILDGRLCANEFFWFVSREHRTGTGAFRLLDAYEAWAKENGAVEARMVHLAGEHAAQLARIYEKRGYRLLEQCFWKPLHG